MEILLIGNDQLIQVTGLQDAVSAAYLNAAAVTARITTMSGNEVAGATWPLTLSYVLASDGDYRGTFEDGVELENGTFYIVEISVDAGSDLIAFWRREVVAQYRTF